jgi:hypothetical protein
VRISGGNLQVDSRPTDRLALDHLDVRSFQRFQSDFHREVLFHVIVVQEQSHGISLFAKKARMEA